MITPESFLAQVIDRASAVLPRARVEAVASKHRAVLLAAIAEALPNRAPELGQRFEAPTDLPPDLWSAAQRTAANLAAIEVIARRDTETPLEPAERDLVRRYSGWGGLSIEAIAKNVPAGWLPESRGLIHEYYTPSVVGFEIGRIVERWRESLPLDDGGLVAALEPSAGIGRLVRPLLTGAYRWTAVEYSRVSSAMLRAAYPEITVHWTPFEGFIADQGDAPRFGLVVSNPPYPKERGAAATLDANRAYRETRAYIYFLRRGLDLLVPGGIGVFLVPSGFLGANTEAMLKTRNLVLRRHHLIGAFRLPSELFPGANLVTDLLFFRRRGGVLPRVDAQDEEIAAGHYFRQYPAHILGEEVGAENASEDAEQERTEKKRFGRFAYQVKGTFTTLPDFDPRPMCVSCAHEAAPAERVIRARRRVGGIRDAAAESTFDDPVLASAQSIGARIDDYFTAIADEPGRARALHAELLGVLRAWKDKHGWPHPDVTRAAAGSVLLQRFTGAFTPTGKLVPALLTMPEVHEVYQGSTRDVEAIARWLYTRRGRLTPSDLRAALEQRGATDLVDQAVPRLLAGDWFLDDDPSIGEELIPATDYLTGLLWDRYDRARGKGRQRAAAALLRAIGPLPYEEIPEQSPQDRWIGLDVVQAWLDDLADRSRTSAPRLTYNGALYSIEGIDDYADLGHVHAGAFLLILGWLNHDRALFSPRVAKGEDKDAKRTELAAQYREDFTRFIRKRADLHPILEERYNRTFRGFVQPVASGEPLAIARWARNGPTLKPHQAAGARRVLRAGGGLVAFDVGVGKTYTGLAIVAKMRELGLARRPVILVPNAIVWKWAKDFSRVLPDYRVAVIGSKLVTIKRGPRKGLTTSDIDTAEERAAKWTAFQAGLYDVVLLTYTALARTRMDQASVLSYVNHRAAIQRELAMRRRAAQERTKNQTERQKALLEEGTSAWIAEQLELPGGWEYDPGIVWDDLRVDCLMVDEAQNFKNLYLPEAREGGVPRFMGTAGEGAKRAWQLDFRAASVRRVTKGSGIVLLSATPAKNSPLEFYSLVQYVDPRLWENQGLTDPESFIDRYCAIQIAPVLDTALRVKDRSACVGFINLDELRSVLFRVGEFKTAEEVGLKLPEPRVSLVELDMDERQEAQYEAIVGMIENILDSKDRRRQGEVLGYLARLGLIAIHPELDKVNVKIEGEDDEGNPTSRVDAAAREAAINNTDPHSPKIDACVDKIMTLPTCAHIVFVENLAIHYWLRRCLIEAGISPARIAMLNREAAPRDADRQRIAQDFNGDPEAGIPASYDIVICNQIAYEGVDLQTRTCAIHHLDLPWEPATLQQRNGRGVRQGNTLAVIEILYYFARRSMDGARFSLISNKQAWMKQVLQGQARETNNPGAQAQLSAEEILLLISRDPEKTRERLNAVREAAAKAARDKAEEAARSAARVVAARFARLRQSKASAEEQAVMRAEAEARLASLLAAPTDIFTYASWMTAARDQDVLVHVSGPPIWRGLVLSVSTGDANQRAYLRIGGVYPFGTGGTFHARRPNEWYGPLRSSADCAGWLDPRIELNMPNEPDLPVAIQKLAERVRSVGWRNGAYWHAATHAEQEAAWPFLLSSLNVALGLRAPRPEERYPVVVRDGLRLVESGGELREALADDGELLAPTQAGWATLLQLAPNTEYTHTQIASMASMWWDMPFPRGHLARERAARGKATESSDDESGGEE